MTNEEETQVPTDLNDAATFKIVLDQLDSYRKVAETNAATMIRLAEMQATATGRLADAFERIAVACETHASVMVRFANGMEYSIEKQFHSVR